MDDIEFLGIKLGQQIERVMNTFGMPPLSGMPINPVTGEKDPLILIGNVVRAAGYPAAADPSSFGEGSRMLDQVIRDHDAVVSTANLPSIPLSWESTRGDAPFVLYLRSFDSPLETPIVETHLGVMSLEELLAFRLRRPWPLIGLGRCDRPLLGVGKIRSTDDTWKRELKKLSLNATLILVVPSATEGTSWEIEWVAINNNLRSSIFLMPPNYSDDVDWRADWAAVQRWARFMGLAFPDYDDEGLLFTMDPAGPVLRTLNVAQWLSDDNSWVTLMHLTRGSSDSIADAKRNMLAFLETREAESQQIDLFELWRHKEQAIRKSIREKVSKVGAASDVRWLPVLERLDIINNAIGPMRGRYPGIRFSEWDEQERHAGTGVYTVWWGEDDLVWADWSTNLGETLTEHARGRIADNAFCETVFSTEVVPSLTPDVARDLHDGLIDADKMNRYHIHKHFSVLFQVTNDVQDAKRLALLVNKGVLSAGRPRLRAKSPKKSRQRST